MWVTSAVAGPGVQDLLKCSSLNVIYTEFRFVQRRLTPLDIEKDTSLAHLKRVRRAGRKTEDDLDVIDVILCAVSTLSEEELGRVSMEALEKGVHISGRVERVSQWPPYTARQQSEFAALWPVTLRKDMSR